MHIYLEKPVDFKKLNEILDYSRQIMNTPETLDLLMSGNQTKELTQVSCSSSQQTKWSFYQSHKVAPI